MITIQASVSKGWLHQEGGFSFPEKYYFDPIFRWNQDREADLFISKKFHSLPIYNMESNLVQAEYFNPNQILIGGIQPNLLIGMALGANLLCFDDKDPDIDKKPCEQFNGSDDLPDPESLLESEIFQLFSSQFKEINRDRPDLKPIPPFFWDSSGRATIHGLITTSQKLIGEKIFIIMLEDPQCFHRILSWFTEAYIILVKHYASLSDISITSIHIGECSAAMISADQFLNTIAPIGRFSDEFNSVRLHSCGHSDHLIEGFSKIKNLSIIDTGSETSIAKIRSVMGNDFEINIAPPVEYLTETAPQERVVNWLDKTIEQNAEGPLRIGYHIEPDYSFERCLQVFEYLDKKGFPIKRVSVNTTEQNTGSVIL